MPTPRTTSQTMTVILERMPRKLWSQARAKALTAQRPIREVVLELITAWVQEPGGRVIVREPLEDTDD